MINEPCEIRATGGTLFGFPDVSWTIGEKVSDVHLRFDGKLVEGEATMETVLRAIHDAEVADLRAKLATVTAERDALRQQLAQWEMI